MAENTKFLDLKKPAPEDFYNIDDFNENFQKIDDFANGLKITAESVGLGNVDNTSDADKPVSTAQAEAIDKAKDEVQNNLNVHASKNNPHGITASTIGLGNVPNVGTNDQTPTYSEASTLATLISGEKISVAFGKIKKAITNLISHIADTTKHITATERTTWNANTTAISEVRTKAENSGFELLKEQVINTGNVYYKSGYGSNFILVTGVDLSLYEELILDFEGTINLTNSYTSVVGTTVLLKFAPSTIAPNSTVDYRSGAKVQVTSHAVGKTHTFNDVKFVQKLINHPQYTVSVDNAGAITTSHLNKYLTFRSQSTGLEIGNEPWNSNSIYLNTIITKGHEATTYATVVGTVKIYGKKAVIV